MSKVTVAAFAVQKPDSPQEKVYAVCVYRTGPDAYTVLTGHGSQAKYYTAKLVNQIKNDVSEADSRKKMLELWREKERKGYSTLLAGPTVFEVMVSGDDGTVSPDVFMQKLNEQSAAFCPTAATVAMAFDAMADGLMFEPSAVVDPPVMSTQPRLMVSPTEVDGIALPNGRTYYSREIAGHSDVEVLRLMRAKGIHMRIKGPVGCGKTTLVSAAYGVELVSALGFGEMTPSDLVGKHLPPEPGGDGGYRYEDGPLVVAMQQGRPFLLDEATRVPPETLAVLNSATDGRGVLHRVDLPGSDPVIAAPGFVVILAYNETGQGVRPLDDSLTRRCPMVINVSTDYSVATEAGIDPRVIAVAQAMLRVSNNSPLGLWVPQMADLEAYQAILDAGLGETVALATLVSSCTRPDSVESLQKEIKEVFGEVDAAPLVLGPRVIASAA